MSVYQIVDHSPHYTFAKGGCFYFSRRVPKDLRTHYKTDRIILTLRTKLQNVAKSRALKIAEQLEKFWEKLRWDSGEVPGKRYLKTRDVPHGTEMNTQGVGNVALSSECTDRVDHNVDQITLIEAKELYTRLKGKDKDKLFHQTANRSVKYATDCLGNKPLDAYRKADATKFRDALSKRGMSVSTIKRVMAVIRSVINFTATEKGLDIKNPFMNLYLGENTSVKKREPIPEKSRLHIQRRCVEVDDEARWLVAMVSDTGMRLSEAAGLHVDDIVLDHDIPHVIIRQHKWRRLKNTGSERIIPLVGASLWAAVNILHNSSSYAFPRYCDGMTTKSNSASAALNKWISSVDNEHHVMHGFRHAIRDRLRAVECPSDIVDQIGGWTTAGIGQAYGNGYPLDVLSKWMYHL